MKQTITFFTSMFISLMINAQVSKTIAIPTAGSLSIHITLQERSTITNLTLTGTIDARDIKFIRDYLPVLSVLDLSQVTIASYYGMLAITAGLFQYPANTIPMYAFYNHDNNIQNNTLTVITLPASVTAIEYQAFYDCSALKTIAISSTVVKIEAEAFTYCTSLQSIFAYSQTPIDLSTSFAYGVFDGINKTTCTLCVPIGSKSAYLNAVQWKDFTNVLEFNATDVSSISSNKISIYPNPASTILTITSDKDATVEIVDINGIMLINKRVSNNETIPIQTLSAGLYIVRIIAEKQIKTFRLIKQ